MTGIPGFTMDLYDAVGGGQPNVTNPDGTYTDGKGFLHNKDGSYRTMQPSSLNGDATPSPAQSYVTEHWGAPTGCVPQDANGKLLGNDQQNVLGIPSGSYQPRCIESSLTGVGIGGGTDNQPVFNGPGAPLHGIQTVDGNYGLDATDGSLCPKDQASNPIFPTTNGVPDPAKYTSGCFQNHVGDFVVHANMPTDNVLPGTSGYNRSLYTVSTEEDVNIFSGDQWVPQGADLSNVTWPPKADPARQQPVGVYPENPGTSSPGPDAQCAGATHTVHVTNPDFLAAGGSPFEGQQRNLCDSKLIHVQAGESVAPNFHVHTVNDVPIPGKFSGYIVDDFSASTDRKSTTLGDVQGIAGSPIGLYDWTGNLQYTTTSDFNGLFEALMPSTQASNCLTPAGVCPNMYRFVGNDPGQFPNPNPNYNPAYKTISAAFQDYPGQFLAADVAPTKSVTSIMTAGVQFVYPPACTPAITTPQIFAVDRPYRTASEGAVTVTIDGQGFGASQGTGKVTLDGSSLTATSWSDGEIKVTVPASWPAGAHQLSITSGSGLTVPQGLTYHVLGNSYNPTVLAVGPTTGPMDASAKLALVPPARRFTSIQAALEYAAGHSTAGYNALLNSQATDPTYPTDKAAVSQALIVVYPADPLASSPGGAASSFTPYGTYYENLVVHSPVKLQGVGPGGQRTAGGVVQGTRIDGAYFWSTNTLPDANGGNGVETVASNEPYAARWLTLTEGILDGNGTGNGWDGNRNVMEGQVVYVVAKKGQYTQGYRAALDGFQITGGDQKDYPGNINQSFGFQGTTPGDTGAGDTTVPGALVTQGGGIFLNAYADHFQITNNLLQGNSGTYGGAIRVGTPYANSGTAADGKGQTNTDVRIANNQILGNGGTNLAGAVGLFSGTNGYQITHNVLCGNYSTEYGGAISHLGLSGSQSVVGMIDHNRIYLNGANDEGGGIMVGGELPTTGSTLSPGAGPVTIDSNMIASNTSDDDGGGLRFLLAGTAQMKVTNNFITNNLASHEGGGIAIDDTTHIIIDRNTIARNVTTATAMTSDGSPMPTGISTARNSDLLQATLPKNSPLFSQPTITRSIISDNRAGSWALAGVVGIGLPGDATAVNVWDVGTVDQSGLLAPTHSLLDTPATAVEGCTGCEAGNPNAEGNYIGANPQFPGAYVDQIDVLQLRTFFRFRPSAIVDIAAPSDAFGDYSSPYNTTSPGIGAVIPGGLR
jgi:hypothetical protein